MPVKVSSLDEWIEEGQHIRRRIEGSTWALGDWLNRGGEWDRGFKRSQAITGYAASTLWNASRTARAFAPEDRKVNLSFTTHRELLRVDDVGERMALLERACKERWTPDDVVRYLREVRDAEPSVESETSTETVAAAAPRTKPPSEYQHVCVKCPKCAHVFEVRGHKVARKAKAHAD